MGLASSKTFMDRVKAMSYTSGLLPLQLTNLRPQRVALGPCMLCVTLPIDQIRAIMPVSLELCWGQGYNVVRRSSTSSKKAYFSNMLVEKENEVGYESK